MSLSSHGNNASAVEVTNISPHGIWILSNERELFLPYEEFPWFRGKRARCVRNVREISSGHCFWPDLDVDLTVESIEHPERFPLQAGSPHEPG
jgi:hypothetical protein